MRDKLREATDRGRSGVSLRQFSLEEKVRANGNRPISSLSDIAELHCVSSNGTTFGGTVPVIEGLPSVDSSS
jgi:hypothetical protein